MLCTHAQLRYTALELRKDCALLLTNWSERIREGKRGDRSHDTDNLRGEAELRPSEKERPERDCEFPPAQIAQIVALIINENIVIII